jgi:HAD superfamily hydrolase (TIGR01509 family)
VTIQALIFDFDGLILDTETAEFEIMAELYGEHGYQLRRERWVLNLGSFDQVDLFDELAALVGRPLDLASLRERQRTRFLDRCERLTPRPGLIDLIEAARARGLGLAVASSSGSGWVEGWLERHMLRPYFGCVRTRDHVEQVKPAPDLFLSAAAGLGVAPEECVVFEDSPNGMRAAAAAGMRCVAVPIALMADYQLPPVALRLQLLSDFALDELLARLDNGAGVNGLDGMLG